MQLCSVVPPTKLAQAISSIFSPIIQLGPNWQQSTTRMAVARPRFDSEILAVFHIIDNKMSSTGHKIYFQSNRPARAKLAAMNNKNGCGTAEV